MNIKYSIISLIMLWQISCQGAACWRSLCQSGTNQKSRSQSKQLDPNQAELFEAAISDNVEKLQQAIKDGADVDICDENGITPLMAAAERNNTHAVQALLENRADTSLTNNNGKRAFDIAFTKNNDALTILQEAQNKQEELSYAAGFGDLDQLNQTIQSGANINTPDNTGFTPLHWAVQQQNSATMKELLKKGAHVNKIDENGKTPLVVAVIGKNKDIVKKLLEHKADTRITNKDGKTALDIAKKTAMPKLSPYCWYITAQKMVEKRY